MHRSEVFSEGTPPGGEDGVGPETESAEYCFMMFH